MAVELGGRVSSFARLVSVEAGGRAAGKIAEYGLILGVARLLGSDGLGVVAFGLVLLRISGAFGRLGMDVMVQKFVPADRSNPDRLAGTVVLGIFSAAVAGTVFGLSGYALVPVVRQVGYSVSEPARLFLLGVPLYTVLRVAEATTRGYKQTRYAVYAREFAQRVAALPLAVCGVLLVGDVLGAVYAYLISLALGAGVGLFYVWRIGALDGIASASYTPRRVFGYALPAMLFSVAHPLILWVDVLVLGLLVPPGDVGLYEAAYQTAILPTFALVAVSAVFPAMAADYHDAGAHNQLRQTLQTVTKWVCVSAGFAGLFLLVFADPVLRLFGEEFGSVRVTFTVLLGSQVLSVATGPVNYVLSMTEYERLEMVNTSVVAVGNAVGNVLLISRYGIIGAAVSTSLAVVLLDVLRLVQVRYLLGFWPYKRSFLWIIPVLSVAGCSMWVVRTVISGSYTGLLGGGIVGTGLVIAGAYVLYSPSDRMLFESVQEL